MIIGEKPRISNSSNIAETQLVWEEKKRKNTLALYRAFIFYYNTLYPNFSYNKIISFIYELHSYIGHVFKLHDLIAI